MLSLPRFDMKDPGFRRLMYLRYADDFIILIEDPKSDAIEIRDKVGNFLIKNCNLLLNVKKTIITHLHEGFNFLGAVIHTNPHVGFRIKTTTTSGITISQRANIRAIVNMPTVPI